MEISLRSYLTAGISLTAATAMAFTPLVIPANEKALTIPSVSISDIQLAAITPADIIAFVDNLQDTFDDINATIVDVVGLPGQTLVDVLTEAQTLNADLYANLIAATDSPLIQALLGLLAVNSNQSIGALIATVAGGNSVLTVTTAEIGTILSTALTGSLQSTLLALLAVANEPLDPLSYALLINSQIGTGQAVAGAGIGVLDSLGNAAFDFADVGLTGVLAQINNGFSGIGGLLTLVSAAADSDIVTAAIGALQGLVLAPVATFTNLGFSSVSQVLGTAQTGFNTLTGAAATVNAIIGGTLQFAVGTIGANPLDPASYLQATGALVVGGFGVFNTGVGAVGSVAQLPFTLGAGLTTSFAGAFTGLNTTFAFVTAGILDALGLPADIVALPLEIAGNINDLINAGAGALVDGLNGAADLIGEGTAFVIDVSDAIRDAIIGLVPAPAMALQAASAAPVAEPAALRVAAEPAAQQSGSATPAGVVADDDEDATDEAPPAEEAPADDDDSAGSGSDGDDSESTPVKAKKTERGERAGSKADRSNSKAGKDSKDSDSSSSGSSSSDSDSGSDSGSGSDGGSEA